MTFTFKPVVGAVALALFTSQAVSAEKAAPKLSDGKLSGQVKLQHVVNAKDNGYDPNSGQGWMLKLKYVTPKVNNFSVGIAAHAVGDIFGVADSDVVAGEKRPASGLYKPNKDLEGELATQLSELYLNYYDKKLHAYAGRKKFNSPLTKSAESTVPDFHQVLGGSYKVSKQVRVGLAHINQMSLGTRAANEYGLMGEGTGTAGVSQRTLGTSNMPENIEVMKFYDISEVALGIGTEEETAGLTVANASYRASKRLNFSVWDYYAHDIYNAVYAQGSHVTPMKGKKFIVKGQALIQTDIGDKLAESTFGEIDYKMVGLKAELKSKKWGAYIALNKSTGNSGLFNAFSGDPGYTSSQFSRNEYREDVTAYKVEGRYTVNPKFIVKASYANYGQSNTQPKFDMSPNGYGVPGIPETFDENITAQTDATEVDVKLIWKAMKKTKLVLTHSIRTSEYDGYNGADLTMAHTRLIGMYNF